MEQIYIMRVIGDMEQECWSESQYCPAEEMKIKVPDRKQAARMQRRHPEQDSFNSKCWSAAENRLYCAFLDENSGLFMKLLKERKTLKINVLMSNFIKTRSSYQCRSHHQKMLKYHGDLPTIVKFLGKSEKGLQSHSEQPLKLENCDQFLCDPLIELKNIEAINVLPLDLWGVLIEKESDYYL